jgi:hypothetical protein
MSWLFSKPPHVSTTALRAFTWIDLPPCSARTPSIAFVMPSWISSRPGVS